MQHHSPVFSQAFVPCSGAESIGERMEEGRSPESGQEKTGEF